MKLIMKVFLLIAVIQITSNAQVKDYALGSLGNRSFQQGGFFDYSDPEALNVNVSVWGWVRYPGKYLVPSNTTASDLLSLAGGPTDAADLEDLRIYRVNEDSTQSMFKFNYNDVLYESKLTSRYKKIPKLSAGDILVVPGEPRLYFRDHFSIWLSVISVLTSLTILIFNIVKK